MMVLKNLKIGTWNINGIGDKFQDDDFVNIVHKYDILFLTETWLGPDESIDVPGYYIYSQCRNKSSFINRNYGGIAILAN